MDLEWPRRRSKTSRRPVDYITQDNPSAAERLADRVLEAVKRLSALPNLGRAATRELVVTGTPFLVVYRVRLDEIRFRCCECFTTLGAGPRSEPAGLRRRT